MITTKAMTIDDYIQMMDLNAEFYPEWAKLSIEDKRKVAQISIDTGIAESHYENGELIGVTGVRYRGIGEAWFIARPDIRGRKFFLFKHTKRTLKRLLKACGIWRMYATSKINENFLTHLGLKKDDTIYCWTRTE